MTMKKTFKEQFEEWFKKEYPNELVYSTMNTTLFDSIPLSMRWGVYQDFADSLGYEIQTYYDSGKFEWYVKFMNLHSVISHGIVETRNEARQAAIEQLKEIINGT